MSSCEVCDQAPSKYKCPKCRLQYCSLACYKVHTANADKCSQLAAKRASASTPSEPAPPTSKPQQVKTSPYEDDILLSDSVLAALRHNPDLANLLRDPRLQEQIRHVDMNGAEALDKLMKDEEFVRFADACLAHCANATSGRET